MVRRTNLSTAQKATTTAKAKMLRVGVVGGGPAGLTFASILSRERNHSRFDISVFERGEANRDQGSGWDLSTPAKEALERAGVPISYVTRKGSDTARIYNVDKDIPSWCLRMPTVLSRLGIKKDQLTELINCETERNKIIGGLLNAVSDKPNVQVHHNAKVTGARKTTEGGVELLGDKGTSLGKFDLLVDASGTRSALRHARFSAEADAFYTGTTYVQGVVYSPETTWDPEMVRRLGEGTLAITGPSKDGLGIQEIYAQRYGAKFEDKMCTYGMNKITKNPEDIFEEIGLKDVHGISSKKEHLDKVKKYIANELSHGLWQKQSMYRDAFDKIDAVRILPIFMHPFGVKTKKAALPGTEDLPLIGIGDALHALPPWSGTSGNFALMDASDLATGLLTFSDSLNEKMEKEEEAGLDRKSLACVVRDLESQFLDRADGPRQRCIDYSAVQNEKASSTKFEDYEGMMSAVFGKGVTWNGLKMYAAFKLMTWLSAWENYGMPKPSAPAPAPASATVK